MTAPRTARADPIHSIYVEYPDRRQVSYLVLYGRFLKAVDAGLIEPRHFKADTIAQLAAALSDAGLIRISH